MVMDSKKYTSIAPKNEDSSAFDSGTKAQFKSIGSSGTEVYSGYFNEEYLTQLRGRRGAKVWDEMRRSEPQVAMLLNAIVNPIRSANWSIQPPKDNEQGELHAEFIEANLKEMIDWPTFMQEVFTLLPFGFSVFEPIHCVVFDHPKFGTFNGLKALAFRGQKTIERWHLEKQTGFLKGVDQYVYSDIGSNVFIPGEFLLVFTNQKEGDNYEGISMLRPMYGPWFRKNLYQKLAAIGIEKYAVGTPIGTVPSGKETSEDFAAFKAVLSAYVSHESSYIIKPEGWGIEIQKGEFDADKIKEMILLENSEMVNSVVANFLLLGTGGNGGAYSLGTDLSDFFLSGIQGYADLVCGIINRKLIPDLIKMNFGQQESYPTIGCTGINDKAGKEFAEIVTTLIDKKAIKADSPLEKFLREQYKLPEADEATARTEEDVQPEQPRQFSEIKLADTYKKDFNANKDDIKELMQSHLALMLEGMKSQIKTKWNAATPSNRILIGTQISAPGQAAYISALKERLAETANEAVDGARKETPSNVKNVKLADSIQLKAPRGGYFAKLPPEIRKQVENASKLIVSSQAADLEKIVTFQYTSSANSTDSIDSILHDIDTAAVPVLEGSTGSGMSIDAAASNAVASVTNQARLSWFFAPEVFETIESFTFTNEAPETEICTELNGTTWAATDPKVDEFSPPLHHNCKSRLVPNIKGDKGNPEIALKMPSLSDDAIKSMTFCEQTFNLEFKPVEPTKKKRKSKV